MGWLASIFSTLISFIPFLGGIAKAIQEITNKIIDLRVIEAQAATDKERIHAEENIKTLEMQRDVLIKQTEYAERVTVLTRLGFAVPVAIVIWKVLVWDKVIGSLMGCSGDTTSKLECIKYTTDALDPNLWWVVFAAICFYFTQNLASIWKRPA